MRIERIVISGTLKLEVQRRSRRLKPGLQRGLLLGHDGFGECLRRGRILARYGSVRKGRIRRGLRRVERSRWEVYTGGVVEAGRAAARRPPVSYAPNEEAPIKFRLIAGMSAVLFAASWVPAAERFAAVEPVVEVEEEVYNFVPADNGAGPTWCFGAPILVRAGETLFATGLETLPDVKPLHNAAVTDFVRSGTNTVAMRAGVAMQPQGQPIAQRIELVIEYRDCTEN